MTTKEKLKYAAAFGPLVLLIIGIIVSISYLIFSQAGLVYGLLIIGIIILYFVWLKFSIPYLIELIDWLVDNK